MNKTCYLQTDSLWGGLGYPKAPWYIRNCGCGEVAITNMLIEMERYEKYTPKTIQPYMKQFAEKNGNGTYHSGIPTAMKHYGLTEVSEHATMAKLWEQLRKGGRIAILLMGSALAGSKKVKWTGSGHFVAVTGYKEEDGKHYVYVKDSASTSSLRNGWLTYEENIRGACLKCWSGKLTGGLYDGKSETPAVDDGKLVIDGIGGAATVKAMQRFFGTTQDGVVSGQVQKQSQYYPSLTAVKYGKGGSSCIVRLQKWVGTTQDGILGKGTVAAWQKKLKDAKYYTGIVDGIFGAMSMKAWQKYLNENDKAVYPKVSNGTKIGEKANELAYSNAPKEAKYPSGKPKAEYKKELDRVYPNRKWGAAPKAGASCDVFVGTCVRASGVDTSFPRGLTEQRVRLDKSAKFKRVLYLTGRNLKESELKDGDIITYAYTNGGGHICIYYKKKLKHAAIKKWYGRTTNCTSRFKIKGKKWIKVYRAK